MQQFAVIPAAGHSRRMGRPKLTMLWNGKPLISHLLDAWHASDVTAVVAVVRRNDDELADIFQQNGATVVQPATDPPDMKTSVLHALKKIGQDWSPHDEDYWLLAPADMPRLQADHINQVLAACHFTKKQIVVPYFRGRSGHPAAIPWALASDAESLPADQGLNALISQHPVHKIDLDTDDILTDIDTPKDFQQLTDRRETP